MCKQNYYCMVKDKIMDISIFSKCGECGVGLCKTNLIIEGGSNNKYFISETDYDAAHKKLLKQKSREDKLKRILDEK